MGSTDTPSATYGFLVRARAPDRGPPDLPRRHRALHERDEALSVGWLIGTARHKLVDHWRREGRQRQALEEL
jgi:predicted RNA polymerase sigma factor